MIDLLPVAAGAAVALVGYVVGRVHGYRIGRRVRDYEVANSEGVVRCHCGVWVGTSEFDVHLRTTCRYVDGEGGSR